MSKVWRLTFKCDYADGTLVEPSLHYQSDVAPLGDEPDGDSVADAVYTHLGADFLQSLPTVVTLHDLVATEQVVPPAIGAQGSHHVGLPGIGISGAQDLPRELVPLVNMRTNTVSRSARGHIFLCGPGDKSKVVDRKWTDAFIAGAYQGLVDKLDDQLTLGAVNPTHLNPVIYSRTRHLRDQDPFTFGVVSAAVKVRPTWLRSRGTSP